MAYPQNRLANPAVNPAQNMQIPACVSFVKSHECPDALESLF